ncbi:HAMP domain-containing histidine kinase [Arcobacteraceae bacterium]|nr:HAMP domain-containing histidine kinase [Arcobacteraceae bacterium]
MESSKEEIKFFKSLLVDNEDWLMNSILHYAEKYDFTRYTSTLKEAWRVSIVGLTRSLIALMEQYNEPPEFHPEEDYSKDPASAFGLLEAKRHRSRGVNMGMFLSLFKYYRQTYHDLLKKESAKFNNIEFFSYYIDRFFDRTEIAYCTQWAGLSSEKQILELSRTNLTMTNEKNKYLTIFDSFGSPVAVIDKEGYIENFNFSAEQIFKGNIVPGSKYYEEKKEKEKFEWLFNEIDQLIKSDKKEISFEKIYEPCNLIFNIKIARLHDVSNKFVGYTILMNDITQIKNTQEQLLEAKEKQLEQERLLIQQSKLASMGEMIGSIAHQWRQPLNELNINIENIEFDYDDGLLNNTYLENFVKKQTDLLQYMSKTIDDFRNFFSISKEKNNFSVKEVVKNSINVVKEQIEHYGIEILHQGEDFIINGYESEFEQVILNFISNAKDAILLTDQKKGKIVISLKDHTVSISDNGGGISDDIKERIFEPYYTTKEQGKGIGMGLYISKMIIEDNMGGIIKVTNINDGACFTIKIK